MKFILGEKIEMTQRFQGSGQVVPVTVVKAGPCPITQVKTKAKDGYSAVQIGFGKKKHLTKSIQGHLKGISNQRFLREFKVGEATALKRGDELTVQMFNVGDIVAVTGKSKGKGFQGVVRRHGFGGGPASHGHKDNLRMPGSIGATAPQRVVKGRRMAGHMGDAHINVANLEIIDIDLENNLLYVKGAVPGARRGLLMITAPGELKIATPQKETAPVAESVKPVEDKQSEQPSDKK